VTNDEDETMARPDCLALSDPRRLDLPMAAAGESGWTEMIRVFARRTSMTPTDELAFYDDGPPLFDLKDMPVRVSVTFSWDIPRGFRFYDAWRARCTDVQIGGPAFERSAVGNGMDFVAGRFLKTGVTITSRGCNRKCPWCIVPSHEGPLVELRRIEPGYIVQDNNLLACSRAHIERVFDMLMQQPRAAVFAGGLDATLLKQWHIDWFKHKGFRLGEAWFACDSSESIRNLAHVADLMSDFPLRKKRCYVLIGFDPSDTPILAEKRCEAVLLRGFCPFAMLYQPACRRSYSPEWRAVQRKWTRPAAYLPSVSAAKESSDL
jgi:hypothetical protein